MFSEKVIQEGRNERSDFVTLCDSFEGQRVTRAAIEMITEIIIGYLDRIVRYMW